MRRSTIYCLLAVFSLLFLLIGNASLSVTDPVESNYALTAKEMVLSGDWISPQIYGTYWYDKPIFIYWLLCLSYTLFGFTEFASRVPGAVFGAASVVLAAWYMRRRSGSMASALLLAAMLLTSLEVWAVSHSVITDQPLFFFTAATMFCAYIGLTEGSSRYMILAYAAAALAVLTKGPVGIVLPGLFLLIFIALRRRLVYVKRLFPPAGIVLFFLLVMAWYGPMYARHGMDFIDGFLGFNNVVRATSSEHPEMNVWYYYLLLIPVSLLPWSGPCLYGLWRRRAWQDDYLYMAVWAAGTILFYTLVATKYPTYAYIANMPLLYLGAQTIRDISGQRRLWTVITGPAIFFWLLFFAAALFAKPSGFTMGSLFWLILFLPAAAALLLFAQRQKAFPAIPAVIASGTAVVYVLVTFQVLVPFYAYRSAAPLIQQAEALPDTVYFFEEYATSFVYATGKTAIWTAPAGYDENQRLQRSAVWSKKHLYPTESEASVLARLHRRERLTIIVGAKQYDDFMASSFASLTQCIGTYNTYTVFTTR